MAPRKTPSLAARNGASSRCPRRAAVSPEQAAVEAQDSGDDGVASTSSSGSEAEAEERTTTRQRGTRARGAKQPAATSKAPVAPAAPAAAARSRRGSQKTAGAAVTAAVVVGGSRPVRGRAAAAEIAVPAAAAAQQRRQQQPASGRASRGRSLPSSAVATARRGRDGEVESAEDSEGEEETEEDEGEAGAQEAGPSSARGASCGAGRGTGSQPLVPPAAAESRKRLFELLERRIGGSAGDISGSGPRRTMYGDLPAKNPSKKAKLLVDLKSQFDDWHSRLRSNFSVLLYGFGSKRGLLDEFARTLAGPRNRGDAAVLVFHGYQPRCTAREVVAGVAGALMNRSFRNLGGGGAAGEGAGGAVAGSGGAAGAAAGAGGGIAVGGGGGAPAALRALVEDIRCEPRDRHAFVVIHNIDGPGLRGDVSLLSSLAACPQVHMIASTDHALAPLLWDSADAARFRWQYFNATTFMPYTAETCGAQSVLAGAFKSGAVTGGAGTVLRSLVLGAQEVFKLLAEHLLEDEECEGVAFAHLYRMCKERYLVRDERVLRQHLVEFVDHELVRLRPASDNSGELLTIPMTRPDMLAVLDDLAAARG